MSFRWGGDNRTTGISLGEEEQGIVGELMAIGEAWRVDGRPLEVIDTQGVYHEQASGRLSSATAHCISCLMVSNSEGTVHSMTNEATRAARDES